MVGLLPELDVVVPVRNVDRYLGDALDSVLSKRTVECTVIVVDAGSDRPIALPERHRGNPNIRLVRSEDPLTAGGARNLGAALGSAPWLSFLDADDLWPPESRAALIEAAVAVGSQFAHGTLVHFHSDAASRDRIALPHDGKDALIAGGVVMSRAVWEAVGQFDQKLRSGEFVEWYNRLVHSGVTAVSIPQPVLQRRLHLESTTAGQLRDRDDYLEVVRRWMNRTS
jgi:glycosyltransferase involved in cell wall biosynthesis